MSENTKKTNSIVLCEHRLRELMVDGSTEYRQEYQPYFEDGDVLWVQEDHARTENEVMLTKPHYFVDGGLTLDDRHDAGLLKRYTAKDMPKWASRMSVVVSDTREVDGLRVCKILLLDKV